MSKRFRITLASALAALALLSALAYGEQVRDGAEALRTEALERYGGEVAQVVVATRAVSAGDELDAANCALQEWLVDLVPEGALTSLDDVSGVPVAHPLARGMPVCDVHLEGADRAVAVPSGKVAVTVPVTERTGVPPDTAAGTALAAYRCADGATRLVSTAVTVLSGSEGRGGQGGTLTVGVPAEDVAAVVSASTDGTLRLVRPAADVEDLSATAGSSAVAAQEEGAEGPQGGEQDG